MSLVVKIINIITWTFVFCVLGYLVTIFLIPLYKDLKKKLKE